VIVKGKSEPVDIHTPCADVFVNETSAKAIAAYRARRWDEAEALWRELSARHPADGVAAFYLERIARLRSVAPGPDWTGATELEKL
jgi:adenylate cyclase